MFKELEGLAVGTECVFSGAATPPYKELWPQFCLDPTHILYNSTSCVTTGVCVCVCLCVGVVALSFQFQGMLSLRTLATLCLKQKESKISA